MPDPVLERASFAACVLDEPPEAFVRPVTCLALPWPRARRTVAIDVYHTPDNKLSIHVNDVEVAVVSGIWST